MINNDEIKFVCKIGKMGKVGKIVWLPLKYAKFIDRGAFVEVTIRKLK
jgi:hypothetical protein